MKSTTCIQTGLIALCLMFTVSISFSQPTGTTSSGLSVAQKGLWPNKTCSVCWENPMPANDTERQWVRQAIADTWEKFSAFRFTGWGACRQGQKGIRILIASEGPHTKGLGTSLDGKANGMVLNFNWAGCNGDPQNTCIPWVAVHEFGHALGIAHEQNRNDAPQACREEQSQGTVGDWHLTPYDQFSVMNYCNPMWNNGGVLSTSDVAGVQKLYGANDFEDLGGQLISEPVACSMQTGRLDVFAVGTDGAAYHKYYGDGAWHDYESLGGNFTLEIGRAHV